MVVARNWLQTLWRTSYKGASFWVETDTESGARRIVIHEFPMRDFPYLEDLGERYREFTVTAYVASDKADQEASALMQVCSTRGPGILVLPSQGPGLVRCTEFTRAHAKDKLGYIAHELKFVREGFSSALATVTSLINMIFVQAEAAATVASEVYAASALIKNVPDYVADSLQTGTENALATLEAIRVSTNVEPIANATQRDAIIASYIALPEALAAEDTEALKAVGESVIQIAMGLTENMEPQSAIAAMSDVLINTPIDSRPTNELSSNFWRAQAAVNKHVAYTLLRIAALISYCEAIAKVKLGDRPSAITLRANVSTYFDDQLGALPSEDYDLYHAMTRLRDATIDYLSRAIIDLAPVITVRANLSMPSLYWAWRLYADPTRSTEIVERNRVIHPSFIPPTFEALGK